MKKNQNNLIPVEDLNLCFDDQKVFDLDQKLFEGEITLEEYREVINKV